MDNSAGADIIGHMNRVQNLAGSNVCSNLAPAARLLKTLGHEGRLRIICHLAAGERSVSELEALLDMRQAAVSQQLSRLRLDGMVTSSRRGKAIIYRLANGPMRQVVTDVLGSVGASKGTPSGT